MATAMLDCLPCSQARDGHANTFLKSASSAVQCKRSISLHGAKILVPAEGRVKLSAVEEFAHDTQTSMVCSAGVIS